MGAPIGNTCPDINKIQRAIQSVVRDFKGHEKYLKVEADENDLEYISDLISAALNVLDDAHSAFEDLRGANDTLRKYGEDMEREAEGLQVQYSELEEKYNSLSEELEELKQSA